MAAHDLNDRRILVVEDEYLIAMSVRDYLAQAGAIVIGPVGHVTAALRAIESNLDLDAAVLDLNLGGALAYDIADKLLSHRIPFVFTSGYEDHAIRERFPRVKNLRKPYVLPELQKILAVIISARV
jgi:CheY-like chemotaxis protein